MCSRQLSTAIDKAYKFLKHT